MYFVPYRTYKTMIEMKILFIKIWKRHLSRSALSVIVLPNYICH